MTIQRPLTRDLVQQAVEMILPAFQAAAKKGIFKRDSIFIVVMDPRMTPNNSAFEESILLEYPVGEEGMNYKAVARGKARRAWETGVSGQVIQSIAPHLYDEGDNKWQGDAVYMGLIVAASGVQGEFDELVSWWVLQTIVALCKHYMLKTVMPSQETIFS